MTPIAASIRVLGHGSAEMTTSDATKHTVDALSVLTVAGTLVDFLPSIAALFTIIWTALRIYESPTVQKWIHGKPLNPPNAE